MTGSLGTVRKSAGALFPETVGVGEVSCLTVKRNAGDQDADQRDHNGGLDIRSLLPCGFLKAVSTLVLPAQIQVVDMDVLGDIRFVRLQINLGAAVFTGDKALLHAVRNMQCSVAVRALDFGNLHVSPSLDQLMNDR